MVEPPTVIGRYRVEAITGTGGYATVYRAHDEHLDAAVAVKVLAENHSFDPDIRERFLQEGRILRHIGSPNVVSVHDVGETDRGQPFLVLDHADRGDLAARVAERRASGWVPTVDDVLAVADALADALVAVHACHIVHRDLAPSNLLLRSSRVAAAPSTAGLIAADERLVLADLGLSKDLATASGLTVSGGTAGFAPPEQRNGPSRVDQRADLWAASALIGWLLLSEPPDQVSDWHDRLTAEGWPPAFVDQLSAGLSADPGARPPDAATWWLALRSALTPPRSPASSTGDNGIVAATPRRRRGTAAALFIAALVAIVGIAGLLLVIRADGGGHAVEELTDGRSRAEATDGALRVAIVGPAEMRTDEPAVFEAEAEDVEAMAWIAPDGQIHHDVQTLEVTATSTGRATVRLLGTDRQGGTVEAVLDVRVVDE